MTDRPLVLQAHTFLPNEALRRGPIGVQSPGCVRLEGLAWGGTVASKINSHEKTRGPAVSLSVVRIVIHRSCKRPMMY